MQLVLETYRKGATLMA